MRSHETDKNIKVLVGNVVFNHEGTHLYCDSAYFHEVENKIDAFSNVRIKMSDTLNIYGDLLKYDGNTKIAEIYNNVKFVDNQTILTTEYLNYSRNSGIASYNTGGKIVDKENVLTSKIGHYYTNNKQFFFKKDVFIVNPKYTIASDTLMYNTVTKIAYFYGPTNIVSKENTIYCENGWYNTKTDKSQFSKNAWLQTKNQHLEGDSLYYDRKIEFGKAIGNVTLTDTVKNIIIKGNYIENSEQLHKSMATDSVMAIFVDKGDSLYIHADTLKAKYDTADNIELLCAYYKVKFFRADIQGRCDSLSFVMKDSLMNMYYNPVLWTDENQLSADTIHLLSGNNKMKEMFLRNNAFIISQSGKNQFNQVKGKNMQGFFADNQLYKVDVKGNSESIYYMKEENSTNLLGINKAIASDLLIFIKNKQIESITFIKSPEGTLYPVNELAEQDRILKNFKWRISQRPKEKLDIFKWE
ncbi:MAG: organic solvent tolerance protein OstA [Bacteroidetes bacterium]|nr:organic solvent tolerance protein OstA [Bacteroidota bacterium]